MHKHCVVTGRLNPDSINFLIVKVMLYEEDTLHNNVDMRWMNLSIMYRVVEKLEDKLYDRIKDLTKLN